MKNLPASGGQHEFYTAEGVIAWMNDAYRLRGFYPSEDGPSGQAKKRAWEEELKLVAEEFAAAMRRALEVETQERRK